MVMKRKQYTKEFKRQIIELKEQGKTAKEIMASIFTTMVNSSSGLFSYLLSLVVYQDHYCFFGNKQENALEAWYINWLGKLAARDLVCVVNERMQQAGGNFYHLLCLQAHLDRCELKRGLFPAREQKRILA